MSFDGKPWVEAETVIPHRPPFRMIDSIAAEGAGSARGVVVFPDDHMGVADGMVLESAMAESMAQATAAMEGMAHPVSDGDGEVGMLCGISGFSVFRRPETGKQLVVRVWEEKRLGSMFLVGGEVTCDGEIVASGQLKLYAGKQVS